MSVESSVKFGLQQPAFRERSGHAIWQNTERIAVEAEHLGFDSYWLMDHFIQIPQVDPVESPMMESYMTMSAVAARTSRIRLGAMITGVPYRNPALLAKMGATIDIISNGRFILGIGAGWYQREFEAYGFGFPPVGERMAQLEDAVQIIHRMWTEKAPSFQGRHHSITEPICEPPPVQRPRPPIMVGGGGERRTLQIVARYADAWNIIGTPELIRGKMEILERHCEKEGRDPAAIEKTRLGSILVARNEADLSAKMERYFPDGIAEERRRDHIVGTADYCIERCAELIDLGLDTLIFNFPDAHTLESPQLFMEEVAPALQGRAREA